MVELQGRFLVKEGMLLIVVFLFGRLVNISRLHVIM